MEQAMTCLDNFTADGLRCFKAIESILVKIFDDSEIFQQFKKKLEKGKR